MRVPLTIAILDTHRILDQHLQHTHACPPRFGSFGTKEGHALERVVRERPADRHGRDPSQLRPILDRRVPTTCLPVPRTIDEVWHLHPRSTHHRGSGGVLEPAVLVPLRAVPERDQAAGAEGCVEEARRGREGRIKGRGRAEVVWNGLLRESRAVDSGNGAGSYGLTADWFCLPQRPQY